MSDVNALAVFVEKEGLPKHRTGSYVHVLNLLPCTSLSNALNKDFVPANAECSGSLNFGSASYFASTLGHVEKFSSFTTHNTRSA
jgi:hypothetical protein